MWSMKRSGPPTRAGAAFVAGVLCWALPLAPARAAGEVDPEAARILQSMSDYLTSQQVFTADFHVESEVIDTFGQKLAFHSSGALAVRRHDRLYARRKGSATDGELFFDGKAVSIFGGGSNGYVQLEGPSTIEQAFEAVRGQTDMELPAADLLYAKPANGLLTDIQSGISLGRDEVEGVPCDHLAFRAQKVDWQLWVRAGDSPVPVKYVITTKWLTGAPQHSIHLSAWNLRPKIDPERFAFHPPKGAHRYEPDALRFNELGEVLKIEGQ